MNDVLLKGHGGSDQLEYRDDVPVPLPKTGEVLIRVAAAGVNNTDINTRTAWYAKSVTEGTTSEGGAAGYAAATADAVGWTGGSAEGGGTSARVGAHGLGEPKIRPWAGRPGGSRDDGGYL